MCAMHFAAARDDKGEMVAAIADAALTKNFTKAQLTEVTDSGGKTPLHVAAANPSTGKAGWGRKKGGVGEWDI